MVTAADVAVAPEQDAAPDMAADVDADIAVDADVDIHPDTELAADAHTDAEADLAHVEAGLVLGLLGFFGLGKAPLTVLIVIFGYSFGLSGYVANQALIEDAQHASAYYAVSLGIALLVGLTSLRLGSGMMARYLPTLATSVVRPKKLVGTKGEASLPINERVGEVQIYDRFGTLHSRNCRVRP